MSNSEAINALFDYVLPTNTFIEFLKYTVIVLGANLACWSLIRFLRHERFWSAISMGSLGFIAAMQEAAVLGQSWSPWRLPMLLLATSAGLRYMYFTMEQIKRGPEDAPIRREGH